MPKAPTGWCGTPVPSHVIDSSQSQGIVEGYLDALRPPAAHYDYERDGREIYRKSFATIRAEVDLSAVPVGLHSVAVRIAHAAGDAGVLDDFAGSPRAAEVAREALEGGAPILTDSHMLASGITRARLPRENEVRCFLRDERVPELARRWSTTRAAAAVSLWEPHLAGAVVAIGNAPTALFHLMEMLRDGAARPACIVGMPVGFIGSAESKQALSELSTHLADAPQWLTVHGRRGGSAMAAAAVNALATRQEIL